MRYSRIARVVDACTPPIFSVVDYLKKNGDKCVATCSPSTRYQSDESDDFYFTIKIDINGTNPCQAESNFHFQVKNLEKTVNMTYGVARLNFIESGSHTTFLGGPGTFEFALDGFNVDNLKGNNDPMKWREYACLRTKKAIFMTSLGCKCKNYDLDVQIENVAPISNREFVISLKYIGATMMESCKDGVCDGVMQLFGYEPTKFKTKTWSERIENATKEIPTEKSYKHMKLTVSFTSELDSFVTVVDLNPSPSQKRKEPPGPPQDFKSVNDFVAFMRGKMGRRQLESMLLDLNQRLDVFLRA